MALAAALLSCEGAYLTAPPDSTIDVSANPNFVAAHGGVSEITAFVIEPAGTYVAGRDRRALDDGPGPHRSRDPHPPRRRHGALRLRQPLGNGARSGPSRGASARTPSTITVGNARVAAIRLRAVPSRITNSNSTHVIATVVDDERQSRRQRPRDFFEVVDDDQATEFFDSAGAPVFTNNNGEAEDVLRTRRNTVGVAEVQATAPNGAGGFVTAAEPLRIPIL